MVTAKAYYNEFEPYAAAWLRNLIEEGLIPNGDVDERDIRTIDPRDLAGYTQCHFFAGLGGWAHALRLAGWPDDRPVWTGSCPCQPFSTAGKRKGFEDERHLWPDWFRLIQQRRPAIVFGEQVASAHAWLAGVRSDLETVGYAVGAIPMEAASVGAPHKRDRYWFVAHANESRAGEGWEQRSGEQRGPGGDPGARVGVVGDADRKGPQGRPALPERGDQWPIGAASMADAERRPAQRFGESGELPSTASGAQDQGCERERRGDTVADYSERGLDVAHAHRDGESALPEYGETCGLRGGNDFWHGAAWVLGADGKARRVKSGIRLLAHGVPARVGKLRALGNAIVPQAAAAFITAADAALGDLVEW